MKKIIKNDPFANRDKYFGERGIWPAKWITHPNSSRDESCVYAYYLDFELEEDTILTLHTSADQRYLLYIDREKQGEGPERGDFDNWFFETYEVSLKKGKHSLLAKVWWITYTDRPPTAQFFWHPAFLLASEGNLPLEAITTGYANWKALKLDACKIDSPNHMTYTGSRFSIYGQDFPWNYETMENGNWQNVQILWNGESKDFNKYGEFKTSWHLRPSLLPSQFEAPILGATCIYADNPIDSDTSKFPVSKSNLDIKTQNNWQTLLSHNKKVLIQKNSTQRIIIDLGNYFCAYQSISVSKGKGSLIRINWAESLFNDLGKFDKGNRDEIENNVFLGYGNNYYVGGNPNEKYETYWWMPGRYVEIYIETKDEDLEINALDFTETHYNYNFDMQFESSNPNISDFMPIAYRTLEMCTHETLMDCPYYEQLMYVGDTRIELLISYATSKDRFIAKKAIDMFDKSIGTSGLTKSRYPSHFEQHIPTFSLFYVAMVSDYAMWTNDLTFVKEIIHGVRGVMDFFARCINKEGLIESPIGWNFTDWVPGYPTGMNPYTDKGTSGYYSIHYMYTLVQAAKLERMLGEPELADRYERQAKEISAKIEEHFWDSDKNLYSDDTEKTMYWEHTQCLAILSGFLDNKKIKSIMNSIATNNELARTTIYFSHYLLEASAVADRMDIFFEKLNFWHELSKDGFKTTPEAPNPTRSDCHAWGAHPLYHLQSNILGIKPASPGFETVIITPRLYNLEWAKGSLPHPKGCIETNYTQNNNIINGYIILPKGISGKLIVNNKEISLKPGENHF